MSAQKIEWYWRNFLFFLTDLEVLQRFRRLSKQGRRKALLLAMAFIFALYYLYPSSRSPKLSNQNICLKDRLKSYALKQKDFAVGIDDQAVKFVGNGYIGIGMENELYVREAGSRILTLPTGYYPLVNVDIPEAWSKKSIEVTDFEKGVWKRIHCYDIGVDCACIEEQIYAHATRPNVLVQDVQIINPTNNALQLKLIRPNSDKWSNSGPTQSTSTTAQTRNISLNGEVVPLAVICSSVPETITILQKREEKFAFICSAGQYENQKEKISNIRDVPITTQVINAFQKAREISSSDLQREHGAAWKELQTTTFYLSSSKAPDVLNGILINSTRYALLSHVEVKGLRFEEPYEEKQISDRLLGHVGKCYSGHSNLLYPSKLWQPLRSSNDIGKVAELWLLTLEKKGCGELIHAGARGVSKAFVLSLLAASFDQNHLEIGIDPADLHRQMRAFRLPMPGASKALVDVNLHLDEENINYMMVSSTDQLFACPAGCQDDPVTLSARPVKMPVKVTKPLTPILYVATNRRHLLQLRSTIHVSEVVHAPAHENEVIALHEHGHRLGGLPTSFWVFLGILLVAFHVFLVKLLWTEWRKGDTTPYNPYLRYRYQSQRNH